MKMKLKIAGALAVAAMLAGGATSALAADASNQNHSGFLADYSRLQPVEGVEGTLRYIDTSIDLKPYSKIMIDPVQVFLTPNPDYKGMQPDALKRMTDAFRNAFVSALAGGYQVVNEPGPDVLRMRMAITGIQATSPALGVTDFIPIKALFNLARDASGNAPKVAEISAEFELLDPQGRVVADGISTRKGEKDLAQGANITWSDLQAIVNVWAKNLRINLDKARGVVTN